MVYGTKYVKDNLKKYGNPELKAFFDFLEERELSTGSLVNYAKVLRYLQPLQPPYKEVTKEEVKKIVTAMKKEGLSKKSITLYKALIKRFFQWVHYGDETLPGGEYYRVYPEVVRWITNCTGREKRELPKRILSKKEIKRLLDACTEQRDRALIFILYESGCRAGEFLGLRLSDVTLDKMGAVVNVDGKTGMRRLRLFESVPDLTEWLNRHPWKNDPDAPLWINYRGDRLGIRGLGRLIKKLVRRAKIRGGVHPHTFRHSRATHLANVLTEAQMKEFFGWEKDSRMPGVYVHLSGRDVDKTLLQHYGYDISDEDKEEDTTLKPRPCPRKCMEDGVVIMYSPSDKFCIKCGSPLDVKTAMEVDEVKEVLREELTVKERFLTKVESFERMQAEMQALRKEIEQLKAKS